MEAIESLEQQLEDDWQHTGSATGPGEGVARMATVRATQVKLAQAYLDAGGTECLEKARQLFVEVLSSREGLMHDRHIDSLRGLLEQLGEPIPPAMLGIAEKQIQSLEFYDARNYPSPNFGSTVEFIRQVLLDVPGGDALLKRTRALWVGGWKPGDYPS